MDTKAADPLLLDVRELVSYADYLLLLTGTSAPHVKALADALVRRAKKEGLPVVSQEGIDTAKWALLDFGDVIAHVFQPAERGYYDLESLWVEAARIEIPGADEAPTAQFYAS